MEKPGHFEDRFCLILEQYALPNWIAAGHFERHIRRMRHFLRCIAFCYSSRTKMGHK